MSVSTRSSIRGRLGGASAAWGPTCSGAGGSPGRGVPAKVRRPSETTPACRVGLSLSLSSRRDRVFPSVPTTGPPTSTMTFVPERRGPSRENNCRSGLRPG